MKVAVPVDVARNPCRPLGVKPSWQQRRIRRSVLWLVVCVALSALAWRTFFGTVRIPLEPPWIPFALALSALVLALVGLRGETRAWVTLCLVACPLLAVPVVNFCAAGLHYMRGDVHRLWSWEFYDVETAYHRPFRPCGTHHPATGYSWYFYDAGSLTFEQAFGRQEHVSEYTQFQPWADAWSVDPVALGTEYELVFGADRVSVRRAVAREIFGRGGVFPPLPFDSRLLRATETMDLDAPAFEIIAERIGEGAIRVTVLSMVWETYSARQVVIDGDGRRVISRAHAFPPGPAPDMYFWYASEVGH